MTPTETRAAAAVMLAHAKACEEQKTYSPTGFQSRIINGVSQWERLATLPRWNWEVHDYRVKPEPRVTPWEKGEGVGKVVRHKPTGSIATVVLFESTKVGGPNYCFSGFHVTPDGLLECFECWDAATQKATPCGNLETV